METVATALTRGMMAAAPNPIAGQIVYLAEAGREGVFKCVTGTVPSDPQQGLYVSSATSGFYYSRIWDGINGKPEWFGAITNGPDCLVALQASIALCPVTILSNDDYYISATLKITVEKRTLKGCRGRAQGRFGGTRLIVTGATADVLQIGTDTLPAGGADFFLKDVSVSSLTLARSMAPSMSAENVSQPTGLRVKYVLNAQIEHIFSTEHALGYYYGGVVASRIYNCRAFRSIAGGGAIDFWWGHYIDGTLSGVGAGGNASIYVNTSSSEAATTSISGSVNGLMAIGAFVDTFISDFEATRTKKGIYVVGTGAGGGQDSNIDFYVVHPVLDACYDRGIEVANVSPGGVVSIVDAYIALADSVAALACYHIHDGAGSVRISGGQAICFVNSAAGGNALGVYADTQSGLVVSKLAIVASKRPIALLTCTDADLSPEIENKSVVASEGAVYLTGSTRVRIVPKISGGANVFPIGVELAGSGNSRVFVDWTRIQDSAVSGGSTNRLKVNGTSYTSTGPFPGGVASGA